MRRTSIVVFVLLAFFASAAYGSKKPRGTTVSTSHRKSMHAAYRAGGRRSPKRASFHRVFRPRPTSIAAPAIPSDSAVETVATPVSPVAVETASLNKRHFAMPLPLRGSHDSLVRQNERSEDDNLERIEDDDDLADRIASGMLVPVPISAGLAVNPGLPENRRYCRPWTASFLADLARAHAAQFHSPLLVTSAVRTVEYQKQLERINGNAAAAEGDIASPHLTGATIDIAKQGLSRQQIAWMRAHLLSLEAAGKIDVEEEFHQSCFHITVYKSYVPLKPASKPVVQAVADTSQPAPGPTVKAGQRQRKTSRRKPAQPVPVLPKPEPEQPSPEATPAETPVEG